MAKKYIDANRLNAEIEKRMHICDGIFERDSDTYYQGKAVAYQETLSLIDSLQQEQPSDELTTEVEKYFQGLWPGMETAEQCNTDMHFTSPAIMRLASHFANWGAEHAKKETPLSEDLGEEVRKVLKDEAFHIRIEEWDFKTSILDYRKIANHFYELGKQSKEPVSEDLEAETENTIDRRARNDRR